MSPSPIEILGSVFLALAILHTFSVSWFQKRAEKYPEGSIRENLFHLLGEVEAVFGIWAAVFLLAYSLLEGYAVYAEGGQELTGGALAYLEKQNFTEPLFVFVIMTLASARPVILLAEKSILMVSDLLPLPKKMAFFVSTLVLGPLLGSVITEPAAMTVTALILLDYFYSTKMSEKFKYATLGLLFVSVSIGGTFTHFAAPPVLMVAERWNWGTLHMIEHFGWKAGVSILVSTAVVAFFFKEHLRGPLVIREKHSSRLRPRWWIYLVHVIFLMAVVYNAHHMIVFIGLLLLFVVFVNATKEYQDGLKIREPMMVGFFLAGLVVLGTIQSWWLKDVLSSLGDLSLFTGATALTAITDNAALTYLGSLVELSDSAKYNLLAGAVSGGGLTVIANAPNPAGYGILKDRFKNSSVNPLYLFLGALGPTVLACLCFQLL